MKIHMKSGCALIACLSAFVVVSAPCKMPHCEEDAIPGGANSFCAKHKCPVPSCRHSGRWVSPPSWAKNCIYYYKDSDKTGNHYFTDKNAKIQFWARFCSQHACKYQGPIVTDFTNKPKVHYRKGRTSDSDVINLFSCDNEKTSKYKYCKRHICPEKLCASPLRETIVGHARTLSKYCMKHMKGHKTAKDDYELQTDSDKDREGQSQEKAQEVLKEGAKDSDPELIP